MQSSSSSSSISSTSSNNSSIYGSQTILKIKDLPSAAPRCRSSIISSFRCRSLLRPSGSSSTTDYFHKLAEHYPILLVLNDYQCSCGCHFSIAQGTFVILVSRKSSQGHLTVISNQLICSKIPTSVLCDVRVLRARVRSRISAQQKQSFDL